MQLELKCKQQEKNKKKEGGEKVSESDMEDQISHCLEVKYQRYVNA